MVDIQSATAEIRQGKIERRRKKQDKNIMSASATQGAIKSCDFFFAIPSPQAGAAAGIFF